jgi:hypothetical protein
LNWSSLLVLVVDLVLVRWKVAVARSSVEGDLIGLDRKRCVASPEVPSFRPG